MDLHVKFDGHEIIITRPGTDMMTAYRKAPERPNQSGRSSGSASAKNNQHEATRRRT